jgi:hypothetical protein
MGKRELVKEDDMDDYYFTGKKMSPPTITKKDYDEYLDKIINMNFFNSFQKTLIDYIEDSQELKDSKQDILDTKYNDLLNRLPEVDRKAILYQIIINKFNNKWTFEELEYIKIGHEATQYTLPALVINPAINNDPNITTIISDSNVKHIIRDKMKENIKLINELIIPKIPKYGLQNKLYLDLEKIIGKGITGVNKNVVQANFEEVYENEQHGKAFHYADNIIDFEKLTFIGGSIKVIIIKDFYNFKNKVIDNILNDIIADDLIDQFISIKTLKELSKFYSDYIKSKLDERDNKNYMCVNINDSFYTLMRERSANIGKAIKIKFKISNGVIQFPAHGFNTFKIY